jgi:hypothetical protein
MNAKGMSIIRQELTNQTKEKSRSRMLEVLLERKVRF